MPVVFSVTISWPGFTVESVAHLTADPGVQARIPAKPCNLQGEWSCNNFYGHSLPSADSRRAVVSYWRLEEPIQEKSEQVNWLDINIYD